MQATKTDELPPEVATEPIERVAHFSLAEALAAFQRELPTVAKGNTANVKSKSGAEYSYEYADLSDVSPAILPLLGKHGMSWTTRPTMTAGGFVLHYELLHEGGEQISGVYPLPDARGPAQELGSAITYARRYALLSVTGVAPGGDDDDAKSAGNARVKKQATGKVQQRPPEITIATVDWRAKALEAKDREQLRTVYAEAELAGELDSHQHADDPMSVGQFMWSLRADLPEKYSTTVQRAPLDPAGAGPSTDADAESRPGDESDRPAVLDDDALAAESKRLADEAFAGEPQP